MTLNCQAIYQNGVYERTQPELPGLPAECIKKERGQRKKKQSGDKHCSVKQKKNEKTSPTSLAEQRERRWSHVNSVFN